jgi:hypothetical protein
MDSGAALSSQEIQPRISAAACGSTALPSLIVENLIEERLFLKLGLPIPMAFD